MRAPYFVRDGATLYFGDCRDILPELGKGSADLVVTDPPYGVNWQSNNRSESFAAIAGDDSTDLAIEATRLALPVLRPNRHLYLFGRYNLSTLPLSEPVELIWNKVNPSQGDFSSSWGKAHEYIQFCTFVPSSANRKRGDGRLASRLRQGSVLVWPRPNSLAVRHPTEKPVGLLRELIEASSCLGETVLDYFAGVGSTLVAALAEGRSAIGIEVDEKYCEIAARRLEAFRPAEAV